ncbi:hypothetical protein F4804DRAFT_166941 [Jackrogersella minutella]|nr:hypothetical protein F4804DRAFT_166941 [Jackrogersella minutella]
MTWAYKEFLGDRITREGLQGSGASDAAEAFQRRFGNKLTESRIWKAVRTKFCVPKAGDLLWRLLHGAVLTGTELSCEPPEAQHCPLDGQDCTIGHIWIECTTAEEVGREFREIWKAIEGKTPPIPHNPKELMALMATAPKGSNAGRLKRWLTSYMLPDCGLVTVASVLEPLIPTISQVLEPPRGSRFLQGNVTKTSYARQDDFYERKISEQGKERESL